jgi:surface antigen
MRVSRALAALLVMIAAGLMSALALRPLPASASSGSLCSGYGTSPGGCNASPYTTHGYNSTTNHTRFWGADPGDNCTNYAAFVEGSVYDVPGPGNSLGNAATWGTNAPKYGAVVNSTPNVGAVAWWSSAAGLGSDGHVAIVESIGQDTITASEDAYPADGQPDYSGNEFDWKTYSDSGISGFIHFSGFVSPGGSGTGGSVTDSDGDGIPNNSDLCPAIPGNGYADGCPREVGKLVGDFTGDGKLDVAAFYRETSSTTDVFVFPGNGDGTFGSPILAATLTDWNSADTMIAGVGDFTDNGNASIAVFYYEGGNTTDLFVLPGNGSGTFGNPILASSQSAWGLSDTLTAGVGNFTGSGQQDIAVFYDEGNGSTDLFVFPGLGNGTFGSPIVGATLDAWSGLDTMPAGIGDFTGDGNLDVAAFYNEGGNVTDLFVLPGNGNGTFGDPILASTQPQWATADTLPAGVGDFNDDGNLDIAAFYNEGGNVSDILVFDGNGNGTFSGPTVGVSESSWNQLDTTSAGVGDFTGDGEDDAAVFYGEGSSTTDLFVLPSEENGAFGNVIVGSSQSAWSQLDTLT